MRGSGGIKSKTDRSKENYVADWLSCFVRLINNAINEQIRLQKIATRPIVKYIENTLADPYTSNALVIVSTEYTAGADQSNFLFLKKTMALTAGYIARIAYIATFASTQLSHLYVTGLYSLGIRNKAGIAIGNRNTRNFKGFVFMLRLMKSILCQNFYSPLS
jgi:hypothetical protein